ncbi:MAG TPA: hypothetical protein VHM70_01580 [Polyangiaceae bacterium]|jgi:hypothetical protein|nr:hypothetical protein [Polyangiaceae bacterium]
MFDSKILDVAIGLALVFAVVSTLCSAVREGLEAWFKTRASYLEHAIRELLQDSKGTGLARQLYEHPLIYGLYMGDYKAGATRKPGALSSGNNMPSYIPSRLFAMALLDMVARGPTTDAASAHPSLGKPTLAALRASVTNLQNVFVQRALLCAIDNAEGSLDQAIHNIEAWYDAAMDRVSGWYKRSTQWVLFGVAALVVSLFDVNAITIAEYLYRDSAARDSIVAAAKNAPSDLSYAQATEKLEGLKLPIGWNSRWSVGFKGPSEASSDSHVAVPKPSQYEYLLEALGLLITTLAATLGAPFWFDIVNKFMVIRSTIKPDEPKTRPRASLAPVSSGPSNSIAAANSVVIQDNLRPTAVPIAPGVEAVAAQETERDGCDHPITEVTADADLPAAEGGVA